MISKWMRPIATFLKGLEGDMHVKQEDGKFYLRVTGTPGDAPPYDFQVEGLTMDAAAVRMCAEITIYGKGLENGN